MKDNYTLTDLVIKDLIINTLKRDIPHSVNMGSSINSFTEDLLGHIETISFNSEELSWLFICDNKELAGVVLDELEDNPESDWVNPFKNPCEFAELIYFKAISDFLSNIIYGEVLNHHKDLSNVIEEDQLIDFLNDIVVCKSCGNMRFVTKNFTCYNCNSINNTQVIDECTVDEEYDKEVVLEKAVPDYEPMKRQDLVDLCLKKGIDFDVHCPNSMLVKLLKEHDRR